MRRFPREPRCRLRDLGITVGQRPTGKYNAITDVPGVKVGHATVSFGRGDLRPGKGPARTGVTAILAHSRDTFKYRVRGAFHVLNGNGIVTCSDLIRTWGVIEGPILLTNTLNVGRVMDAAVDWVARSNPQIGITEDTYIPIVGECDDSSLNDIQGRHVRARHVFAALDCASSGPVPEGDVGAGKGMICYDFKGGIGTSSRKLPKGEGGFTVGVLVNCNHGNRDQFKLNGFPLGLHIPEDSDIEHSEGSIVIVVATDAPLNPLQLQNLATRATLGLALTGGKANHGSGDFVLAFSNAHKIERNDRQLVRMHPELDDWQMNGLYEATIEATEEAVLNALCMANTVVGQGGNYAVALPLRRSVEILAKHGLVACH